MSVPGAIHSNKSNHLSNHHASQTLSSLHDANGSGKRKVFDASDQSEEMDMGAVVSQSGSGYSFNLALSEKEHEEENADFIPPVRVEDEPDLDVQPFILNQVEMQQIAKHVLPTGIAYCKWIRLYSLVRDGDSFDACLRLVQDHVRTLMVVRTSRNQIMGGFADNAWKVDSGAASYYGGPEACLFKIVKDNDNESRVKAYKWTGRNRYIQLCDHAHKMLAFGGGGEEGAFGLSVEQDFLLGSTGPCATFDNEPLCDQDTFEIVDLEIYGYLIGQF
ncbi:oxidation resistance protein 1 [Mayamaea pseudoterrestris]|nr:oxidation resistance protein 1 [Mayamaea pseudoterrestris]